MNNLKRIVSALAAVILVGSLFACEPEDEKVPTPEPDIQTEEKVIFSVNIQPDIICNDPESISSAIEAMQLSIFSTTYRTPAVYDDTKESSPHEIVLGVSDRAVSKKAYELLETCDIKGGESSYLIYSDGESLAVAYNEDRWQTGYGLDLAMEELIKLFDGSEKIIIPEGEVTSLTFDVMAYQQRIDDAAAETKWQQLTKAVNDMGGDGEAVTYAVKEYYEKICTEDIIDWFANLYDPTVGGYYFSNGARDTDGYLPDLESTSQAIGFLQSSGMLDKFGGSYKAGVPLWMQEQIIAFCKKCQDPETGFFYHPQWTKAMVDAQLSRRARDMDSATGLLNRFGSKPTYDAPNGTKGDGIKWDGTSVSLTGRLIYENAASLVSKIIPTSSHAAHLENDVTFRAYLDSYDTNGSFYWIGSNIGSQESQIKARDAELAAEGADYRLGDILIEWFNGHQNTETGLWNDGLSYECTNALLKIGGLYTTFGHMFPNADKAIDSCLKMTTTDEYARTVVQVYNVWFGMKNLMINIETFAKTEEEMEIVRSARAKLLSGAPEAIKLSMEKQLNFKCENAGFCYYDGYNCTHSQGLPVAPSGTGDGDVNATVICMFGTINRILDTLGISRYVPSGYTETDRMRYFAILEDNYSASINAK